MAGVGKFNIVGQRETAQDLLARYKLRYSSNHNTQKYYRKELLDATKASNSDDTLSDYQDG